MPLKLCVLASSSAGNCTYVASEHTAILIDAGLSARQTADRLSQIGVTLAGVQAICLTHEHADHIAGVPVLHRRNGLQLYANSGTIEGVAARGLEEALNWNVFVTGQAFRIGDLTLEPFSVPHDAYDPVGFVIGSGDVRIGVVTDMGVATTLIRERLRPCQVMVVESNHDEDLLRNSGRPWHLKQRIIGRQGHLSNAHAADLIAEVAGPALAAVFLAHLSGECNRPDLALKTTQDLLRRKGLGHVAVKVALPDQVSDVWVGP